MINGIKRSNVIFNRPFNIIVITKVKFLVRRLTFSLKVVFDNIMYTLYDLNDGKWSFFERCNLLCKLPKCPVELPAVIVKAVVSMARKHFKSQP